MDNLCFDLGRVIILFITIYVGICYWLSFFLNPYEFIAVISLHFSKIKVRVSPSTNMFGIQELSDNGT